MRPDRSARLNPATVLTNEPDWKYAENEVYKNQAQLNRTESRLVGTGLSKFVLRRGPGTDRRVSLTFDDGPHPDFTPRLLDILKAKGVKATFFVIGHMADRYPDLVRRMAREGHEVGNHTYSHVTLPKIPEDEVFIEYKANDDVIHRITGKPVRFCRPPGGDYNERVLQAAASLGLTTVLWTDDPGDYANPGDEVLLTREVRSLNPGGIILLHDGSPNTIDTLGTFIDTARRQGYRFVSLTELARPSGDARRSLRLNAPSLSR